MSSSSKPLRLLGAVLIVVAAGAVGFYAYRGDPPADALVKEVAAPSIAAAAPADDAAARESPKGKTIPDSLPDITLTDVAGKPTKLSSFAGPTAHGEFLGYLVCAVPPGDPAAQ